MRGEGGRKGEWQISDTIPNMQQTLYLKRPDGTLVGNLVLNALARRNAVHFELPRLGPNQRMVIAWQKHGVQRVGVFAFAASAGSVWACQRA